MICKIITNNVKIDKAPWSLLLGLMLVDFWVAGGYVPEDAWYVSDSGDWGHFESRKVSKARKAQA